MDDLVNDFLAESHENLERLDAAFATLEQDPNAAGVIADVFRTIHTIKGTCGFLGFAGLERLSHGGESLLACVRDGERSFDAQVSQALFELVEAVREILASIERTGAEGGGSYDDLIAELLALSSEESAPAKLPQAATSTAATPTVVRTRAATSIRVDAQQLDLLMNLVGELVAARNQIQACAEDSTDAGLRASSRRLAQITGELQERVMRTRMQPIGSVWTKAPRQLSDLSAQLGKRVRLQASGAETPIDRSIVEMLRDPWTHVLRNAVDHGIETPQRRVECGKDPEGTISIRAWAAGGSVHLVIEDDGAGIDPERVRRKAVQRGVIDAAQAARMQDAEAIGLIFQAGFSTAEQVSRLSGRGVGMDVVKTNIERLGGRVSVTSTLGVGTKLELTIPLSLAILRMVLVECAGSRFAIAEKNVLGLARLPGPGEPDGVAQVQGASVLPWHGTLLPLVDLRKLLELPPAPSGDGAHVVVLEADGRRFGLVVDALHDIEEIVVKPLGPAWKSVRVYSGATIQGDGSVALILDVQGLSERGRVARFQAEVGARPAIEEEAQVTRRLLLLDVPAAGRVAIDLECVLRLEEVPRERIEVSLGRQVFTWREEIVPLVALDAWMGVARASEPLRDSLQVVICDVAGRRLGLIAAMIADVAEEPLKRCDGPLPRGIRERGILRGVATAVLDLESLARDLNLEPAHGGNVAQPA